jgi:NAD(P)-dependent dehydrogenase (short-subunit alcohol dehydrogenase family)
MTDGLHTFDGGVAIVTGAASGIGRAISKALAQRGCQVVLADIDCGDAETAAAQIRDKGGRASAKHLDVCNFAAVSELVTETMEKLGRIDYLFNNAGIGVFGEVADYPLDAWHRVIAVNLGGVVNGVQAAYAAMIRQGFGHIVNTASIAGLTTSPAAASYSATKHAVVGLSKALRAEAQCRGVRVSVICPGVIRTPLLRGGKHGIFLMPLPEDKQREIVGQLFELLRPMDVSIFARKVLDRVARNRAIIVVPGWYKIFWWIERASPTLGAFLARKAFERHRKLLFPSGGPTHDKANGDAA